MRKGDIMFSKIFGMGQYAPTPVRKEGDLFKVIELYGEKFEIRYGYYEDFERQNEPIEIYPDFKKDPVYTFDGYPFITLMQDICEHYRKCGEDSDLDCSSCIFMERGDELIAVCRCPKNRRKE